MYKTTDLAGPGILMHSSNGIVGFIFMNGESLSFWKPRVLHIAPQVFVEVQYMAVYVIIPYSLCSVSLNEVAEKFSCHWSWDMINFVPFVSQTLAKVLQRELTFKDMASSGFLTAHNIFACKVFCNLIIEFKTSCPALINLLFGHITFSELLHQSSCSLR